MTAEDEFSAVFARHYRDVERYLYRRAPDAPVTDLVAEVFLVAWRRWEELPAGRELPWLYAAAGHVLANELRGRQRHRRLAPPRSRCAWPAPAAGCGPRSRRHLRHRRSSAHRPGSRHEETH
ncbi:hypothetical protein GCM10020218_000100 [Dactylosporangium vinaceum]|uniref:RNA polymerase sigma factor n=1 Tax=Dactylosporangium vinaceum TaxID=53362 RepID=A0ABV5M929_9ACTN|nr:sigma factor [Dactylosporangium vinaceum]